MTKTRSRKWRLQFSLRAFLALCLCVGGPVAWLSNSYHEYQVEQDLLVAAATKLPPGSAMTVATNGETVSMAGNLFM